MEYFSYRSGAARIEFGRGAFSRLPEIVEELSLERVVVLSTEHQRDLAERASEMLGATAVGIFANATMHTPTDVTEDALKFCRSLDCDGLIAVGGGSTTGLGKAISYRSGFPNIVVPTTYAGSEVTPILGQTENGIKTTLRDDRILPSTVIYDPDLSDGLPLKMSVVSGLNAMAHAAEALYAKDRNPISTVLAIEGLGAMRTGLSDIVNDQSSAQGRDAALYGAWLCGTVLGQVGMALHHKICHTLGGSFNMPHAETHAVMLAHTIGFNAGSVPELLAPVRSLFNDAPGAGLYSFAKSVGAPLSLRELGFQADDLDRAAEIAAANPYWNPRAIDQPALRSMLEDAFDGVAPGSNAQ